MLINLHFQARGFRLSAMCLCSESGPIFLETRPTEVISCLCRLAPTYATCFLAVNDVNFCCIQTGDYSRCGEVVVESAYVKLCSGDTPEALSMFKEVQETANIHKDDFLSQVM